MQFKSQFLNLCLHAEKELLNASRFSCRTEKSYLMSSHHQRRLIQSLIRLLSNRALISCAM